MDVSVDSEEDIVLIDFSSNSEPSNVPKDDKLLNEKCNNNEDQVQLRNDRSQKSTILCGHLNKFNSRGILRTFRKRWFLFSQENCKLYYYKSQQDQVPLGEIDISRATFTFDVTNKERSGLFTISVPGKEYALEANSRQACLYWLQELQKYRRACSLKRTARIQDKTEMGSKIDRRPRSGLVKFPMSSEDMKLSSSSDDSFLMVPIDCPISVSTSANASNPISMAQQKISNLKDQVINSVAAIRQEKSFFDLSSHGNASNEFGGMYDKRSSSSSLPNSIFFDNEEESNPPAKEMPNEPAKSNKFSGFKSKLSESFRMPKLTEEQNILQRRSSKKIPCIKCQESNEKIESLLDEVCSLQDELTASRSVIQALQQQLDISLKENESITCLNQMDDWTGCLEMLSGKDQKITSLNQEIQEKCKESISTQRQIVNLTKEVTELQEKNSLFEELLKQKDKMIMSLTNEVFELETERKDQEINAKTNTDNLQSEIYENSNNLEKLEDAVQAFELQNKFLNHEILELNQLRDDSEHREMILTMKCSEWEARCCQIQSKLLFLLKEFQKDKDKNREDVIARLLEEALPDQATQGSIPNWSIENEYDDLGFNWKWGKDDLLSTKAANLRQRSEDITNRNRDADSALWSSKWDNFMVSLGTRELRRSPDLKILIRQGVPLEYKGKIWKGCIEMRVKYHKIHLGPNYYKMLLNSEEFASRLDPSSKQIELDLLRTLPNNRHYENTDSDGIPKLRRVLLAYSRHDPSVGYCQGLNRLAAIALLFMEEEDAFWCLVAIIRYLMPDGYYSRTLIAAQVDQRVLKDLLLDKLPRLQVHFDQHNIDLSLFTFNWFLTVFVDNIPVETYLRIWDVFLYEGSKILFRYALAFFKYYENEILQLKEYVVISKYLQNIAENMIDVKRLTHIAFNELNPFPQKMINTRRTQHMQIVKAQIEEMENLRKTLPSSKEPNNKELSLDYQSEED